ncbi:MAG: hypothetical protein R2867_41990, partial [Caldilineaceae bacterium]
RESIFAEIQQAPGGLLVALMIVLLAGLSEALGQSIILFVNRVSPRRFVIALIITAANHVVGYLLWVVTVRVVGYYIFARFVPWPVVASAVGLAYAPQILAFFELTPFFGNSFSILFSLWSMMAIVVAVRFGLGLETWQAIVVSGVGWLAIQLWRRTIGRPIYGLGRWLQRRAAGVPLTYSPHDLPTLRRYPGWLESFDTWRMRMNQGDLRENMTKLVKRERLDV